jgi:hypothetical protein
MYKNSVNYYIMKIYKSKYPARTLIKQAKARALRFWLGLGSHFRLKPTGACSQEAIRKQLPLGAFPFAFPWQKYIVTCYLLR